MKNNLENKKYWLRGGMIGIGIFLIVFIILDVYSNVCTKEYCGLAIWGLALPWENYLGQNLTLGILLNFFCSFVVGALIGWIYGKIKRRGEK